MAFCHRCGARLPENGKFCQNCGTPVLQQNAAQRPTTQQNTAQRPTMQQPAPQQPVQRQPVQQPRQAVPPQQRPAAQQPTARQQPQQQRPAAQQQPQQQPRQGVAPYGYRPNIPQRFQGQQRNEAAAQAAPKKKSRLGLRLVALLLVAALGITGFWQPGFILKAIRGEGEPSATGQPGGQPAGTKPQGDPAQPQGSEDWQTLLTAEELAAGQARGLSTEVPVIPKPGNSKAIDAEPLAGFHVHAEADAFEQDTEIQITRAESFTDPEWTAAQQLYEEGYCVIDAYHVDAGLADDQVIPGEYQVTIDLATLELDPGLYEAVRVFRVAEDGAYYECASYLEDGKLSYRADQNSVISLAICTAVISGVAKYVNDVDGNLSQSYFYDNNKKTLTLQRRCPYFTFRVIWSPEDISDDEKWTVKKLENFAKSYSSKADELYKKYKEDLYARQGTILGIFATGKSKAQILKEAVEADPEYQELQAQLQAPKIIEETSEAIQRAAQFLYIEEIVRMPTGVVEITSVKGLSALGKATTRSIHEGFIEINLANLIGADTETKDDFLMTMTHELFHVCQQKYRLFYADDVRFDEMAAVEMEPRALEYFIHEGYISQSSHVSFNPYDYWCTLKLPIDTQLSKEDGEILKNEGYNLSEFVKYLEKMTGKGIHSGQLMNYRSSVTKSSISTPLMRLFEINEFAFDFYYRSFIKAYKDRYAIHATNPALSETYKLNSKIKIERNGKYHVDFVGEGAYSTEARVFQQKTKDPMILLLIPDPNNKSTASDCELVPTDRCEPFDRGLYIPFPGQDSMETLHYNRSILEIHGALGTFSSSKGSYDVYVLDTPGKCVPRQDESCLYLQLPAKSTAAAEGAIDGVQASITYADGKVLEVEVTPDLAGTEVSVHKAVFYGKQEGEVLQGEVPIDIRVREFVKAGDKYLYGEESEVVHFVLGGSAKGVTLHYSELYTQLPGSIELGKLLEAASSDLVLQPDGVFSWDYSGTAKIDEEDDASTTTGSVSFTLHFDGSVDMDTGNGVCYFSATITTDSTTKDKGSNPYTVHDVTSCSYPRAEGYATLYESGGLYCLKVEGVAKETSHRTVTTSSNEGTYTSNYDYENEREYEFSFRQKP